MSHSRKASRAITPTSGNANVSGGPTGATDLVLPCPLPSPRLGPAVPAEPERSQLPGATTRTASDRPLRRTRAISADSTANERRYVGISAGQSAGWESKARPRAPARQRRTSTRRALNPPASTRPVSQRGKRRRVANQVGGWAKLVIVLSPPPPITDRTHCRCLPAEPKAQTVPQRDASRRGGCAA